MDESLESSAERPKVLAILNVTPDSFSDGGEAFDHAAAVARAWKVLDEGADALDIGGESTRPGSRPVAEREELERVVPVLDSLAEGRYPIPISIDTRRARVAAAANDRGATTLNDTAALRDDPELARVAAERGMTVVLMHRQGTPETMQTAPGYADVVAEVREFFAERVAWAESAGIPRERLVLDPGIGFGKRLADNLDLIARLAELRVGDLPLMVGASRKTFLGHFDDRVPRERLPGSLAVAAAAARADVEWLRVHDVRDTVVFLETLAAFGTPGRVGMEATR